MSVNRTSLPWRTALTRSAVFRAVGLSIVGFIVWLWLFAADGPPWSAVSLVAVQALPALVGIAWYLPRVRTERRWRAALDHYAELQYANGTSPRRNSRP
jgi:hypothetical protein